MIPMRPLLLLSLLLAGPAWAERPITFREALTGAEEANPALARARLEVSMAESSLLGSKGIFDPSLEVDGSWRRSRQEGFFQGFPFKAESRFWTFDSAIAQTLPTGTTWSIGGSMDHNFSRYETEFQEGLDQETLQDAYTAGTFVTVTQQLLRGHLLAYNLHHVTRAREGVAVAELDRERARQEVLAQTAQAYWTWVYQARLVEIAEENEAVAEEALRIGILRLESGELAPVEKTRLEAALVQARSSVLEASIAAARAADAVLLLMGERPGQEVVPATALGEVPELDLDVEAAVEVALAQNLDLELIRAEQGLVEIDRRYARHALLPSLAATVSTGIGAQQEDPSSAITGLWGPEAFPHLQVGGALSVPLGNRAARGEARRAGYALESIAVQVEELERSVRGDVEQQVRELRAARRRMELADVNLRLAEETLAAEEALEAAGRAIQKDVLEARAAVTQARVEAAKARADYRQAQTELLRLQGQIDLALP